jgi:hypothetical protein
MLAISRAHERKPHERRTIEIKPLGAIRFDEAFEPLAPLAFPQCAPIEALDRNVHMGEHILCGDVFPAKAGSQDGVAVGYPLPGVDKPRFVKRLMERRDHLLDVDAGMSVADGMEQHARLHGREFVTIDRMSRGVSYLTDRFTA